MILLPFDKEVVKEVSVNDPVTILVDPVSVAGASRKDRYILSVEDVGEIGSHSENLCMIVAAYGNSCPFKDRVITNPFSK